MTAIIIVSLIIASLYSVFKWFVYYHIAIALYSYLKTEYEDKLSIEQMSQLCYQTIRKTFLKNKKEENKDE